ncbi:hypothetical protein [Luteibacter yeojuensis]|uniref:Uncharacterized protein n=1 Tax=Luteibacter yeojuensis TaxID=345309 RepID=A0A7X5QVV5_9GAMM|nr:hypothetical protein [Luteibacter yeojuensis]NID16260.1 hypothetical protein [Luteibacter yeojuensis]
MEFTIGMRTPGAFTAGKCLERERSNEFGFRDHPIEKGNPSDVAEDLPEYLQDRLTSLDLRSIDSAQLRDLAANLLWEGYISESAFAKFAIYHMDHPGPLDLTAWIDQAQKKIDNGMLAKYPVAIREYEAGIDAAEGIRKMVDYLSGQSVDVQA